MTGLTLHAPDAPELTCSDPLWIDLPGPARLGFDPGQALDLRHVLIEDQDLAPLRDAPPLDDPIVARALQGLMFTCGPDHIRQSCQTRDAEGRVIHWPLHGNLVRTAAQKVAVKKGAGNTDVRASIDLTGAHGGRIRILRHYHIRHDPLAIVLSDQVINLGGEPFHPMMMYHINIPGRFLSKTSAVVSGTGSLAIGLPEGTRKTCEAWDGRAHLALTNAPIAGLTLGADTGTLPLLQTWQHSEANRRILSIEPVSHPLEDRTRLLHSGALLPLLAGGSLNYTVSFVFMDG